MTSTLLFAMVDAVLRSHEWRLWHAAAMAEGEFGYTAVRHLYLPAMSACDQVGWWRSTWQR